MKEKAIKIYSLSITAIASAICAGTAVSFFTYDLQLYGVLSISLALLLFISLLGMIKYVISIEE